MKLLYEAREAIIQLFTGYSSIVSDAKYKTIYVKEIPSMSARVACSCIAKVSIHLNLKILTPKQLLQN